MSFPHLFLFIFLVPSIISVCSGSSGSDEMGDHSLSLANEINPLDGDIDTPWGEIDYQKGISNVLDSIKTAITDLVKGAISGFFEKVNGALERVESLIDGLLEKITGESDEDRTWVMMSANLIGATVGLIILVLGVRLWVLLLDVLPIV